jgi:hypothetical protein
MAMLIAAQALAQDFTLITHNLKEFDRILGLRCEAWVNKSPATSNQFESLFPIELKFQAI